MDKPIILQEDEYCHILNNDNGSVELQEGPLRLTLFPNQSLFGTKKKKVILSENEYCIVRHVFDQEKGACAMGVRQVRKGPLTFSLYPAEELEAHREVYVLNNNQAAVVQAIRDHADKKAGEKWMVRGPFRFIPTKHESVVQIKNAINVSQQNAIYVRNTRTAELKLVEGPVSYMLEVDEVLYHKALRRTEYQALGMAETRPSENAFVIQIQKNEIICVLDFKNNTEQYVLGPQTHILGPHEGIKVLSLSGGVPKEENVFKVAKIRLGPDFMNDNFTIRTKDNALLKLHVTYKWKFVLDSENLHKVFSSDFIGYSCQSMRSRIREEAAAHDFEQFHTASAELLRNKLFKDYTVSVHEEGKKVEHSLKGRYFSEFGFLIFELDVREVVPVDEEIARLLNESIKSNMKTLCTKLENSAQLQAEKERIESEVEISKLRKNLIEIENTNFYKTTIEKAKIEGQAAIEKAKAQRDAFEVTQRATNKLEVQKMESFMQLLGTEGGAKYLEYIKAAGFHKNIMQACVVPSDTKTLFLPPMAAETLNNDNMIEYE